MSTCPHHRAIECLLWSASYARFQSAGASAWRRKLTFINSLEWGMFKLVPRRKNYEISGSRHSLKCAGFVGIFTSIQTHMNISEFEPAIG